MLLHIQTALLPVLFVWCSVSAQPNTTRALPDKFPNASFLHYTTDQGLSSDYITAVAKDNRGFLWVGTVDGLNRFDGRRFKVFRPDSKNKKNSIPGEHVLGIAPAPDGWLWIATTKGLCKLDPHTLAIRRILLPENADSLENDVATAVSFDSKGMAWTSGEFGIYRINPATGKVVSFFKTNKAVSLSRMVIDRQDRLWLLKDTVRRFDPATGQFKAFFGIEPNTFVEAAAMCLVQDASGRLLAGSWYGGIWEYSETLDEFVRFSSVPSLSAILQPDVSGAGEQFWWVGGGTTGLGLIFPSSMRYVEFAHDSRDPFTHNNYLATNIFKDPSSGDIWISTEVGLEHFAPATIRFGRAMIPPEKDMGQFSLVCGAVQDHTDSSGQRYVIALWGTGLFLWDKATGKFVRMRSGSSKMTGAGNFNLFQDSRGYIWACRKSGVSYYHPETERWQDFDGFFQHKERNNLIWCGLEDRQGNLWFGSNKEGLFRYNRTSNRIEPAFYKKEFTSADGYLNINRIAVDAQGRLWLACYSNGLIRYDPATGESKQFFFAGQNIPNNCAAVLAASNGRIYATFYDALVELDTEGKLLRHFTQDNGLKTNRLFFLVEDRQGKIWCNTQYLLHCLDPVSGTFNYYGKADGMFSNIMTDALCITPQGEIFVGFQNAFNFFYPEQLFQNRQPPPVAITSIKVMNKEVEHDKVLTLRPGEDFFEIEFAALNFNQQERNRYAYLLEGFNTNWVYTDRPVATFTNLDGGEYLLRMKAANNDGVWNEQGITLAIRVIPPFYKAWWFFVLSGLAIIGIAAAFLWFRWRQHRRLEIFRENLASDLHDEMGSILSSIRFFSEFASQQIGDDKPAVTPVLRRISQNANALSESMQDIVWAMKTKNDKLDDLAARMTEFGFGLLEARNIDFKTQIKADFLGEHLHPQVRRNIYLIFKEALNNAAKYSKAGAVELFISMKKGLLLMEISDNGAGFDLSDMQIEGGGNGLQNMRKRAADIGGRLEIYAKPGEGTRVELRVKVH